MTPEEISAIVRNLVPVLAVQGNDMWDLSCVAAFLKKSESHVRKG